MKYYLIYMYQCKVVDVCSYDDEDSQMKQYNRDSGLSDYMQPVRFDSIQIFNQVC